MQKKKRRISKGVVLAQSITKYESENKGRGRSRSSNNRRKKGATKENSVHQIGNVLNGSKKSKKKK